MSEKPVYTAVVEANKRAQRAVAISLGLPLNENRNLLRDWYNRWTRMWFLIGKHAEVDLEAKRTTKCKVCDQEYNLWYDHPPSSGGPYIQGWDISAETRFENGALVLSAGYCSDFDYHKFEVLAQSILDQGPVDGICDWCIRRWLNDGKIKVTSIPF